jgi:carbamoyl-phosphate synthase small subunit
MKEKAILALEDGTFYRGYRFGYSGDGDGEVVFNTVMTGYQEVCTDPSYHGQMVVFTYPLIGNYGINMEDVESRKPWVAGVVVREYCPEFSNWRATGDLHTYLETNKVPGIYGVDTRALTRHLRDFGTMRAVIMDCPDHSAIFGAIRRAGEVTPLSDKALVAEASPTKHSVIPAEGRPATRVAVVDCGIKYNIVRSLQRCGAEVVVLPYNATAKEVLATNPNGILFSNGPGDPATLPQVVECMRGVLGAGLPIMGICLGHQILGQAIGGTTSRLKFGHHGGNHPVKDLESGRGYITSQNHEFQVDAASIPADSGFFVNMINLNDQSVEGLKHKSLPIFSVQYHPEGAPGPQDNQYLFDKFVESTIA